MIVDRYDPMNLFEMVPKLELEFEPELVELDRLLEDDELFELVKADLLKRYLHSERLGRHSTPVEVILRMLVVKKLYGWSYASASSEDALEGLLANEDKLAGNTVLELKLDPTVKPVTASRHF